MSVRIRTDGTILCAAMFPAQAGDTYLDDEVHYRLAQVDKILVTEPMDLPEDVGRGGHARHGQWWWADKVPADAYL